MNKLSKLINLFTKYASAFEGNCEKCGAELKLGIAEPYSSLCMKCEKEKDHKLQSKIFGFEEEKKEELKTEKPEDEIKETIKPNDDEKLKNKIFSTGIPYIQTDTNWYYGIFTKEAFEIPENWNPSYDEFEKIFTDLQPGDAKKIVDDARANMHDMNEELKFWALKIYIQAYKHNKIVGIALGAPYSGKTADFIKIPFDAINNATNEKDFISQNNIPQWFNDFCNYGASEPILDLLEIYTR